MGKIFFLIKKPRFEIVQILNLKVYKNKLFFFFDRQINQYIRKGKAKTGTPNEYTRNIQRGRKRHKRRVKTKNYQPTTQAT